MNKTEFTERTARLMGARSRRSAAIAAVVLLLAVSVAGALLAKHFAAMRGELEKTRIAQSIAAPSEGTRLTEVLSDSASRQLLMKYVDSLARVYSNLEAPDKWKFAQFSALLDASVHAGGTLASFVFSADGRTLEVACEGGNAEQFCESLTASGRFAKVEEGVSSDGGFTANCYIS